MITIRDYFGSHGGYITRDVQNAKNLLAHIHPLLDAAAKAGVIPPMNPKTGTQISGEKWGGWRTQACPIGAPNSAHKTGEAIDIYDPENKLDAWLTDERLEKYDLYREHPEDTLGWCHLSTRAPRSGRRTFKP
jgi:hypothetical protein